jgi:uncharacterized protein YktB (UPF0637 family)
VATLGLKPTDFELFRIADFDQRMQQIYGQLRPKLLRLGGELAPELGRKLHMEFFPHVARHARRTVNPPPETWVAFGPSPKGYKRHGYLALCISGGGVHARAVVKSEAEQRSEMARLLGSRAAELTKSFKGAPISCYEKWDFNQLPAVQEANEELWQGIAERLKTKSGGLDAGFGWNVREALKLDRAEVLDAFRELEPLYRILRSVA